MLSPARQQYLELKSENPDAILLYRMGDFYEMFDSDAVRASKILGIQLTARAYPKGEGRIPMAGVPHHSVEGYIKRLLDAGCRVAIGEQVSEPGKGLVDRRIVRVFTPGTIIEPEMLPPAENNYLAAISESGGEFGLAYVDITTGEFAATEFRSGDALTELEAEILRVSPAEILLSESDCGLSVALPARAHPSEGQRGWFLLERATDKLLHQLQVGSLSGFGCEDSPLAVSAAGAILAYLEETNQAALTRINRLRTYSTGSFMVLDRFTRSSLELLQAATGDRRSWNLLRVLDHTKTGMGGRLLRSVIGQPLLNVDEINRRLDAVECLVANPLVRGQLASGLSKIGDTERLVTRVCQGKAHPHELVSLALSLEETGRIRELLGAERHVDVLAAGDLDPLSDVAQLIRKAIDPEPGGGIKHGYNAELDSLKEAVKTDRAAIAALERREAEATGIKSLRIGYNKVFGYYFEVRKADVSLVPDRFLRQQTLVNAERFSTPEVKNLESRILGAGEAAEAMEKQLYTDTLLRVSTRSEAILDVARKISWLDVFQSLADVASLNGYVRPRLDAGTTLKIQRGRHPVVEAASTAEAYVPNDCCLDEGMRIIVLTGPNMGGKSTMLRMVALIVLMAQMGSFVPADAAHIGIVDRIFSRVGAQDDISAGQSTFMTEMVETANILHHATPRSLLVLDEIGRGTSTYDGLAIARAVIEYVHSRLHARTLFATHYHELTILQDEFEEVANFHTSVAEEDGAIVFLHQVVPGGSDRSYGIHVARLAGLPHSVTVRAERILRQLERSKNGNRPDLDGRQMALFNDPDLAPKSEVEQVAIRVLDEILALDLGNTTPLEALERLHDFQEKGRSSA